MITDIRATTDIKGRRENDCHAAITDIMITDIRATTDIAGRRENDCHRRSNN